MMQRLLLFSVVLLSWPPDASAAQLVVRDGGAAVLRNCSDEGSVVASLEAGSVVNLQFAVAGVATECYSIAAETEAGRVTGYVKKSSLGGLDELEAKRRESSSASVGGRALDAVKVDLPTPDVAIETAGSGPLLQQAHQALQDGRFAEAVDLLEDQPVVDRDAALIRAQAEMGRNRPQAAQAALERALVEHPEDPDLLGLAGAAAYRRDRAPEALRYLNKSLEIRASPMFEGLRKAVAREVSGDQAAETKHGMRLTLRYEGKALPDAAARTLTAEFEREINRVTFRLGCRFEERIAVIVRTLENYRQATGANEWSGGRYDGRLHIAVPPSGEVDESVRETFAHEFVHACLARMGAFPSWFHEGVAQLHSGRRLSPTIRAQLEQLNKADQLPSLSLLRGGWGAFGAGQAGVAYGLALAASQVMYQDLQDYGVRNLLNNPERVPDVEKRLDQRLRDSLR